MEQNKKKAGKAAMISGFKTMPAAYADRSFLSAMITVCQAFIPQVIRISVDGVLGSDLSKIPEWVKAFFIRRNDSLKILERCLRLQRLPSFCLQL